MIQKLRDLSSRCWGHVQGSCDICCSTLLSGTLGRVVFSQRPPEQREVLLAGSSQEDAEAPGHGSCYMILLSDNPDMW